MDSQINEKIEELWKLCGPIDCFKTLDDLRKDIIKFSHMITPCLNWLSLRKKLKNMKSCPDSYSLKHEAENELKEWVPHSVFVFAAFLDGFNLSESRLRDNVYVVSTNIGAVKRHHLA